MSVRVGWLSVSCWAAVRGPGARNSLGRYRVLTAAGCVAAVSERSAGLPGHEQDGVEGPPGHRDVLEAGGGQGGQVLLDHRQRLVVAVPGAVLLRRDHRRARVPQAPVPGAG